MRLLLHKKTENYDVPKRISIQFFGPPISMIASRLPTSHLGTTSLAQAIGPKMILQMEKHWWPSASVLFLFPTFEDQVMEMGMEKSGLSPSAESQIDAKMKM